MRPIHTRAGAIAGSLGFAFTCAASLPAAAHADSKGSSTPTIEVADRSLAVGQSVRVSGRLARALAGRTVVLEYRRAGTTTWSAVDGDAVGTRGRYWLRGRVPRSGALRVTLQPQPGAAVAAAATTHSRERRVAVTPRVRVASRRLNVTAGRRARVAGRVLPGTPGLRVALQVRRDGRWRTLDRDRTARSGRFVLRDRVRRTQSARTRVVVPGYDGLSKRHRKVGRLNVYRYAHASWYGPGLYGNGMACGGTLTGGTMGVAHKTLPCGTKVTLRHRGRTVRVRVVDRGPYVAGREYDLTSATAQRLGFHGHGAILATK